VGYTVIFVLLCLAAALFLFLRSRQSKGKDPWAVKDVMVGTVRTPEQLQYNLTSCTYYAPAKFVSETRLPVTYIALHEQGIGVPPGIKRYARVLTTQLVPRGNIPVSMRPNTDPEEPYYFFHVGPWQSLPRPIAILGTRRGKPRFTTKFLLDHCTHSYQLFSIASETEFRLMEEIYKALEDSSHTAHCSANGCRVILSGGYITVTDEDGRILDRIRLTTYRKKPRVSFYRITRHIRK
jgi:hypothetical protein